MIVSIWSRYLHLLVLCNALLCTVWVWGWLLLIGCIPPPSTLHPPHHTTPHTWQHTGEETQQTLGRYNTQQSFIAITSSPDTAAGWCCNETPFTSPCVCAAVCAQLQLMCEMRMRGCSAIGWPRSRPAPSPASAPSHWSAASHPSQHPAPPIGQHPAAARTQNIL